MTPSTNSPASKPTLLNILKRHTLRFLTFGLLGALVALGVTYTIPKQWPATMLLQIGQIGGPSNLLADPNNVVQRIKFPSFVTEVLQSQNLPSDESKSDRSALIKKTLTATLAKGGNLLEMKVSGYSPEEAQANLSAAFQILQNEHAMLLTPSVTKLKNNLADVTASLKKIEDERSAILEPIKKANSAGTIERKFSESILLASMLKSNDTETRAFRDQINSLDEQLSPYRTFNTKAVTEIYVPKPAAYPKKIIGVLIGLILGCLIAAIWSLIRDKDLRELLRGNSAIDI
ncbi:hypothetical protein [Collimonas pratensis]|nr:hypothetical protein [Collimonas pratensis]